MRGWRVIAKWIAGAAAAAAVASWSVGLEPAVDDGRILFLEEEVGRVLGAGAQEAESRRVVQPEEIPVPLDLPRVEIPLGAVLSGPEPVTLPMQTPGCAYRAPVTSSLARLTRDADSYYQSGLAELQADNLADAQFYFEQSLRRQTDPAKAGDSAFWIAEILRREGKTGEAIVYYRKVEGTFGREALYRLARLAAAEGRREEAREAWERIAGDAAHPRRAEALAWLGGDLIRTGDPAAARERLDDALKVSGGKGEAAAVALLLRGFLDRSEGALAEAEKDFTRYLLHWPDHSGAQAAAVALGWVYLEGGKYVEADRRFRWVLDRGPDRELSLRALYGRVRAAAQREDPSLMEEALADLAAKKPGQPWQGWAEADRGWVLFRRGIYEEALAAFRSALAQWKGRNPGAVQALVGESLLRLGRPGEAADALTEVDRLSPAAPAALHRGGEAALAAGDAGRASRILGEMEDRYPSYPRRWSAKMLRGKALLQMGRVDEALRVLEAVPEGDPAYADALFLRGRLAFDAKRWDGAAALFSRFLDRYSSDRRASEATLLMARAHFLRGAHQAALAALEILEKKGSPADAARARAERGTLLLEMGRDAEGWKILESLLAGKAAGEWSTSARLSLAESYFRGGRYEDALRHLDATGKETLTDEEGGLSARLRAESLLGLGRLEEALEAFRRMGESAEGLYGVSRVLARQGKLEDLSATARSLASRFPDDERGVEALLLAGEGYAAAGRHDEAAATYGAAAAASSDVRRSSALLRRAKSLALAARLAEAESVYGELAGEEGPSALEALGGWAELLEASGRSEEAASLWLRLGRRDIDGAGAARAFLRAGRLLGAEGRWEEARAVAEEGLARLPPGNDETRRELLCRSAEASIETGHAHEAVEMLREAAAIGGSEAGTIRATTLLARAQEAKGLPDQALETYLRIGYRFPLAEEPVAEAWIEAGRLLDASGRSEEARSVYQRLVSEAPEPQRREATERLSHMEAQGEGGVEP